MGTVRYRIRYPILLPVSHQGKGKNKMKRFKLQILCLSQKFSLLIRQREPTRGPILRVRPQEEAR